MSHVDEVKVSDCSHRSHLPVVHLGADSDRLYPRVTIGKLPDDALLEIFVYVARREVDFYSAVDGQKTFRRWMVYAGACVQTMEICRVLFTASPGSQTFLHELKTSEEAAQHLATIANFYLCQSSSREVTTARCHQSHGGTRATRSCVRNHDIRCSGFVAATIHGNEAISGADNSGSLVE